MFILGQGVQTADGDAEILLEHFQQGDVELGIFVPQADHIAFVGGLSHDVHRQQQNGRIARPFAGPGLVPAQKTQRQIKSVGTVFFQRGPCRPIQTGDGLGKFRGVQGTTQAVVLEFRMDQCLVGAQNRKLFRVTVIDLPLLQFCRAGRDAVFLPIGKGIFQPG